MAYHENDVIFTEESLIAFIKCIHDNIGDNYHFVSTINMMKEIEANSGSTIFTNKYENEINHYFEDWEINYPSNICIINNEIDLDPNDLDNGRYTWVSSSDILDFEDTINLEDFNFIDPTFQDYNEIRSQGTILLNQNNGQNIYCIKVKGFDESGNFNNCAPISSPSNILTRLPNNITTDILYADLLGTTNKHIDEAYINNAVIGSLSATTATITNLSSNITIDSGAQLIIKDTTDAGRGGTTAINAGTAVSAVYGSINTMGGIAAALSIKGMTVHAAVFNDYAECRKTISASPGYVVIDQDDGSLICSQARLQPGAQVISDTYGNLMGETEDCKTPIAVAGRVLVYPYQPRENYHAGMAVCSAPNGTVDIMTREEIREYPDCIIGIVSEIPQYEKWGSNQVNVDGRIWIKVK